MKNYLISVLESELFSTPWPTFVNKHLIDGTKVKANDTCKTCQDPKCAESKQLKFVCDKGLVSYSKKVSNVTITVFGFENDNVRKRKYKTFPLSSYNIWIDKLLSLGESIESESLKGRSEVLHLFHDPVKWAEQIKISSEKLVENQVGLTFREKFTKSNGEIKAIYQSSKLLTDMIKMLEIYFNPESASFGRTKRVNVYKLFDKVQSILFFSEGKKVNKRFYLKGSSHREIYLYESFPIIPLSILHNAIKYSKTRDIDISIEDVHEGVEVKVASVGPQLSDDEIKRVFDKGFRGKYAKNLHHDGMGVGLYVTKCIAQIHNFEIKVFSRPLNYSTDNIPMAENTFSFTVSARGV